MDLVKDPAGRASVTERADATRSFNKLHYMSLVVDLLKRSCGASKRKQEFLRNSTTPDLRFDDFYAFGEKEIIQLVEPFCTHL